MSDTLLPNELCIVGYLRVMENDWFAVSILSEIAGVPDSVAHAVLEKYAERGIIESSELGFRVRDEKRAELPRIIDALYNEHVKQVPPKFNEEVVALLSAEATFAALKSQSEITAKKYDLELLRVDRAAAQAIINILEGHVLAYLGELKRRLVATDPVLLGQASNISKNRI